MTIATRSELVTEVQNWLYGRTDLTSRISTFIRMFEAKATRTLRCRQMEQRATATVNSADAEPEFVSLPSNFHSMRRVRNTTAPNKPTLSVVTSAQLDLYRQRDNTSGAPQFFAVFGDEMELYPVPDQDYVLEMVYRRTITPLVADADTNWLLDLAPDLYLYGVLMEAAPYLRDDERIPVWANGLQGGFEALNKLSDEATYNAGPLVIRRRQGGYS